MVQDEVKSLIEELQANLMSQLCDQTDAIDELTATLDGLLEKVTQLVYVMSQVEDIELPD